MRLPLGTSDVSGSGGTVTLIGRRGHGDVAPAMIPLSVRDAVAALAELEVCDDAALASADRAAPRFAEGEQILWCYRRVVETARVVRDDEQGLVVWIPAGSARLEPVPTEGRHIRDVPLEQRFSSPWTMSEAQWTGAGVLRVAPRGAAWSLWFFRDADGAFAGLYVNIELPHRRIAAGDGEVGRVMTADLVLDVWMSPEHEGSEDVWLKDADELAAAVDQGRFTPAQAEAIRTLADLAMREVIEPAAWPLGVGWESWVPSAAMDEALALPDTPWVAHARTRSGQSTMIG